MFHNVYSNVVKTTPLVHTITNYVTVNDVANVILASGGSPIMADEVSEVEDITTICSSLVINMGTLNARTIDSMRVAGKKANALGRPVVFDPVGAGASALRNETALKLLETINFSVIRGNISEIKFLATGGGTTKGVDAAEADRITDETLDEVVAFAKRFAAKTGSVIAITGAIDVVADGDKAYVIKNGHASMSKITGTGCMLTGIIGAYVGANVANPLEATASAVVAMGLCGEMAHEKMLRLEAGTGTLRTLIIDALSNLTADGLEKGAKVEIK